MGAFVDRVFYYSTLVSLKVTGFLDGPAFEFSGVSVIVLPPIFVE